MLMASKNMSETNLPIIICTIATVCRSIGTVQKVYSKSQYIQLYRSSLILQTGNINVLLEYFTMLEYCMLY